LLFEESALIARTIVESIVNPVRYQKVAASHRAEGWSVWLTFSISPAAPGGNCINEGHPRQAHCTRLAVADGFAERLIGSAPTMSSLWARDSYAESCSPMRAITTKGRHIELDKDPPSHGGSTHRAYPLACLGRWASSSICSNLGFRHTQARCACVASMAHLVWNPGGL
jgi:hypothetical protein